MIRQRAIVPHVDARWNDDAVHGQPAVASVRDLHWLAYANICQSRQRILVRQRVLMCVVGWLSACLEWVHAIARSNVGAHERSCARPAGQSCGQRS
jgi:hypothetical protein